MDAVILFDGVCNLCDKSVQFVLKRDRKGYFKFASLQGEIGRNLLEMYALPLNMNSFILIENKKAYFKSNAALRVCAHLNGPWKGLFILRFIPPFIRDILYDIVAKNRYKWFGKMESCMLPKPEWKNRFLD